MVHVPYVSAMLTIRHLDKLAVPVSGMPRFVWRVWVSGEPEIEVAGIVATRRWGALSAGAQVLGVDVRDVEAEVIPRRGIL